MKKILIVLVLLFSVNAFANNQIQYLGRKANWDANVQYDKKVVAGTDSLFTANHDTAIIKGASDSVYTKAFANVGDFSFSIELSGGTTNRIIAEVQVVNSGSGYNANEVPDSLFQTSHWLESGTGLAGNIISTTIDSMTSSGNLKTTPIAIYIEQAEIFRILFYSTAKQVGNPRIISRLYLRKDGYK